MPRPTLHTADHMLDVARDLVLSGGVRAVTVNAIAAASGAPKGSLYHRFGSLEDLLAEMWLRAVRRSQERFLAALEDEVDPVEAAVAGALSVYDFAAQHPADARLLAALRREDLVESVRSSALRDQLAGVNRRLYVAFAELARRRHGTAARAAVEHVVCAVADIPHGAMRRHLVAGTPLPAGQRGQVEAAVRAALAA